MLSEQEKEYLKGTAVFSGMDEAFLSRALEGAVIRRFNAGAVVMEAGEKLRALGVLVRGEADVFKHTDSSGGAEGKLFMSVLKAGDLFGAVTMFAKDASAATEVRTRRGCTAVLFSQAWVETLMREEFDFARNYIVYLTGRVRFLTGRIESIACPTAAEKLLNHLAQNAQDGVAYLPHGMQALADALSISRASLYRVMEDLEQAGKLTRRGKTIYLGGN